MNTKIIVALVIGISLIGLVGGASAWGQYVYLDEMGDVYWSGWLPVYAGESCYYGLVWTPTGDYSHLTLDFPNGGWVKSAMEIRSYIRSLYTQYIGDEVTATWDSCASGHQSTTSWGSAVYYWQGT